VVSGASRAAWSPSTSVAAPPRPNTTSGPKTGSWTTPTITSVPPVIMGWTSAPEKSSANRPARVVNPARASAGPSRSSSTPPASLLCTRPHASALIATRPWLTVYQLPPYAHELNPVEPVWSHLKRSLVNLAKRNLAQLTALVKTRLRRM